MTNKILDDLVEGCKPREMELETRWSTRGGIHSVINADYYAEPAEGEDG